ncbi:MAG: hypothetical protein U1F54_00195 [Burkholderiales bacterium]
MTARAIVLRNKSPETELVAAEVEVVEAAGQMTTYRIRYPVNIVDGDLSPLRHDHLKPGTELAIVATDADSFATLVEGPVYAQRIHLPDGNGDAWVDVLGADGSAAMDRENKVAPWAGQTDSAVVESVIKDYGFTPDVETTQTQHTEAKHALVQRGTDLALVRRLARRNGFLFWVTSDVQANLKQAHFKRAPVDGKPALELKLNIEGSNVDAIDIEWDIERPTSSTAMQLDFSDKGDIDGAVDRSPLNPQGDTGLADITADKRVLHLVAPVDDQGDLRARGEAALIEAGFFVRAFATTNTDRLKGVLRAHTPVGVRGAGTRHSGTYFCARVVHSITEDAHTMSAELWRNAWNR